jgi:hypothetical protein
MSVSVPLGAYPQSRLYGQAGTEPSSISTSRTKRIVITTYLRGGQLQTEGRFGQSLNDEIGDLGRRVLL